MGGLTRLRMSRPDDGGEIAALLAVSEATMGLTSGEEAGRLHRDDEEHEDERPDALVVAHVEAEVVVGGRHLLDEADDHAADHDATEAAEPAEDRGREPAEHDDEAERDVDLADGSDQHARESGERRRQ